MRLVSFKGGFGRVEGDLVVPMGTDLVAYLEDGLVDEQPSRALEGLELLAPVPRPEKIVCIGRNYLEHAEERNVAVSEEPILFAKFANSLAGHGATVPIPSMSDQVDWEAELGVVIGRRAKAVAPAEALSYVGGYTCLNDLSARDLQLRTSQWTRGKAVDGFLPAGPWLVTPDEVGDPQSLEICCRVNGEIMQQSNTARMIVGVAEMLSFVSQTITLEPGDYLATGTPAGVGLARTPPLFLVSGDSVDIEIGRIGTLTTHLR